MYLHAVDNFSWNIPKVYRSRWQIIQFVIVLDEVTKQQHPFICKNTVHVFFKFHYAPEVVFYRLISFKATQLLNNFICVLLPTPIPILSLPPHKGHFQEMHGVYASIEFVYFRLAKHAMLTKLPSCQQSQVVVELLSRADITAVPRCHLVTLQLQLSDRLNGDSWSPRCAYTWSPNHDLGAMDPRSPVSVDP